MAAAAGPLPPLTVAAHAAYLAAAHDGAAAVDRERIRELRAAVRAPAGAA